MSRSDSPLRDRVIFLVGARRSGTNWLQRALASHPEVVGLPSETYLFANGIAQLAEGFQHANPGSLMMGRLFMRRDSFLDAVRDLVDRAFLENLEHLGPGARYCIERTPWHASHLELIRAVYPDARVIHIIRDGRAVARSLLSMEWGPNTMEEAAQEWRQAIADARAGGVAFGTRYREVFYERLLGDLRHELARLLDWLELEAGEDTWNQILLEAGSEFNVDPGSPGVRQDKWRDELSDADIRTFERIAGPELDLAGYDRAARIDGSSKGRELSGRLTRAVDRGRRLGRVARHPRSAVRAAANREYARRARRLVRKNHEIVERFERMLADGRVDDARSMMAKDVKVRLFDGTESFRGRGEAAVTRLLTDIQAHLRLGSHATGGELHGSPGSFTSVVRYQLGDATSWTRIFVIYVTYPKIVEIVMYRFQVASTGANPESTPAHRVPAARA